MTVAAGVYTHYYGFLDPAGAHDLFAVGWVATTRNWRVFARWVGCGAVVLLLFLPWTQRALNVSAFPGWRDPGQPWMIPWRYLTAYTVGDAMPDTLADLAACALRRAGACSAWPSGGAFDERPASSCWSICWSRWRR